MTRYSNGRVFEHKVRKLLEEAGYYCTRSAGSKGVADIWAVRKNAELFGVHEGMNGYLEVSKLVLVQCKKQKAAFDASEWDALHQLAMDVSAVPVLCEYISRKPPRWWRLTGPKIPRKQMEENSCVEWQP